MKVLFLFPLLMVIVAGCNNSFSEEVRQYREEYKQGFLNDPQSPLQAGDLENLDFFPPHFRSKVKAKFVRTPDAAAFEMPTFSGVTRTYRKWGTATFHWKKKKVSLALYENLSLRANPVYEDYLFLPFKDETNSESTYGGGRYLNMSKADASDGEIVIDFNKCYNPWCAYSDGFNCPIPPAENHLPFSVKAGEKNFKGKHKVLTE